MSDFLNGTFRHSMMTSTPVSDFSWMGGEYRMHEEVKSFMEDISNDGFYTPDLQSLMKQERHLIFVYGTLKEGFLRNRMLKGQEFVGYASTDNRYNMFVTTGTKAPFPVVMLEGDKEKAGAIFGEVYSVVPSCIRALDYFESNGSLYKRYLTPVIIGNKDGTTKKVYAWMYKGLTHFWTTRMSILKQLTPHTNKKRPNVRYYMFKPTDAQEQKQSA